MTGVPSKVVELLVSMPDMDLEVHIFTKILHTDLVGRPNVSFLNFEL